MEESGDASSMARSFLRRASLRPRRSQLRGISAVLGFVTRATFDALTTMLVRENFFRCADAYYDPELVDGTSVSTSVATDTVTKIAEDSNGAGPANLVRIEQAIEATASAIGGRRPLRSYHAESIEELDVEASCAV